MRLLLTLVLACFGSISLAQHPILASINLLGTEMGITIDFVIKGGNTCNGINIYHRSNYESAFRLVGQIPGICGSSENDSRYDFTHTTPVPFDTNHYYLEFGGAGPSESIPFYYVPFQGDPVIINRTGDLLRIFIKDMTGKPAGVTLFDLKGREVAQSTTYEGFVAFNTFHFKEGILILHVAFENGKHLSRKLVLI